MMLAEEGLEPSSSLRGQRSQRGKTFYLAASVMKRTVGDRLQACKILDCQCQRAFASSANHPSAPSALALALAPRGGTWSARCRPGAPSGTRPTRTLG